jgi:hypothetical protein
MNKVAIPSLAAWLTETGTGVLAINPKNSLEDYFLSLTNPANYVESAAN